MIINKNKCVQITCGRLREHIHQCIVNEGIRGILNLSFFLQEDFALTKSTKMHVREQKQKRQHFYAHKKHLKGGKSLIHLFAFLCFLCTFYAFCAFLCVKQKRQHFYVLKTSKKKKVVCLTFCAFCAYVFYAFCECEIFL